jgi:putative transcriptional regulator
MKNDVKFLRRSKEFDLSQEQLAVKVGVSRVAISKIEKGTSPNLTTAMRIARFFNCKVEDIFFV